MHNLDYFQNGAVIFKYDLKFSEYNRKHLDKNSIDYVKHQLLSKNEGYEELLRMEDMIFEDD